LPGLSRAQDSKDERHLKFYEVDAAEATLRRSSWASVDVEPEAHQLFALPAPLGMPANVCVPPDRDRPA